MAIVLVPAVALAVSLHQQRLYQSKAQVLLNEQNFADTLTGAQNPSGNQPDRITRTQADVARVRTIVAKTLERVGAKDITVGKFLAASKVSTAANSDLLTFKVKNHDPFLAQRLANAYAIEYTLYRRNLDTTSLARARAGVDKRLRQLEQQNQQGSALYASLADRDQQLATMEALETSNANVVQSASKGSQVKPRPTRNTILGLAVGVVFGIGLAFLREGLDTRVRSAEEVAERLGLPLLARVPTPSRRVRSNDRLSMIAEPESAVAESFRMLRTNLDFVLADRGVRTLMLTSAVDQEGKSTTAANLAVALARVGVRVTLVDLDIRLPYLHRFFDLEGPGLTRVAIGKASLDEAVQSVAIAAPSRELSNAGQDGNGTGNGHALQGMLEVLPLGPPPPDPGEFVRRSSVREIVETLSRRADLVLIDAPPLLHVGDALALSRCVDALLVVARMNVVRRDMLKELARSLDHAPMLVVGVVATAAEEEPEGRPYRSYGYRYRSAFRQESAEEAVPE